MTVKTDNLHNLCNWLWIRHMRARNPANVILFYLIKTTLSEKITHLLQHLKHYVRLNFGLHQEEQTQNEKRPKSIVSISYNRDRNDDGKRYKVPTLNDIAMIFQNPVGEPPFHRDFKVYPRNEETPLIDLNILRPNLDPMTWAIFIFFSANMAGNQWWKVMPDKAQIFSEEMWQYSNTKYLMNFIPTMHCGFIPKSWSKQLKFCVHFMLCAYSLYTQIYIFFAGMILFYSWTYSFFHILLLVIKALI